MWLCYILPFFCCYFALTSPRLPPAGAPLLPVHHVTFGSIFQENNKDEDNPPSALIDVPVQDVIKFVRDLLMHEDAPSAAASSSSVTVVDSVSEGNDQEADENDQQTDQSEATDKVNTSQAQHCTPRAAHAMLA